MAADDAHIPRSLRVFVIARSSGDDYSELEIDLPVEWAKRHERVVIGFVDAGPELGWHAHVVGDGDEVLLSFPWYDHADEMLRRTDVFPMQVDSEGWSDVEQGWWGRVVADDDRVYLAETNFDELISVAGVAPAGPSRTRGHRRRRGRMELRRKKVVRGGLAGCTHVVPCWFAFSRRTGRFARRSRAKADGLMIHVE
jgi:hypothetical protein